MRIKFACSQRSCLQEHGHKTLSASTIPEALALLDSKEPIDVLFTDIGLKGEIHASLELAKEAVKHRPTISRCSIRPDKG